MSGRGKMYAKSNEYVDRLLSGILEMRDYLLEKKPDVVCITGTKLREEVQMSFKEQEYTVWRERERIKQEEEF